MSAHTHDDDRLTFGCPECVQTVQTDQASAALAAGAGRTRKVTVSWSARASGKFTLDAELPDDITTRNELTAWLYGNPAGKAMFSTIENRADAEVPWECDDFEWDIEHVQPPAANPGPAVIPGQERLLP